jgi:PAS domain S-box-containing protein
MSSQRFSPEFKEEAVRQVLHRGYSVKEIAERMGVSTHSLNNWVRAARETHPDADELTASTLEIQKLKAELRRVRQHTAELEKANKTLREIKARFEAVYNHHYQLTGLLDVEGRLLMGNRTALEFAGIQEQDVVGKRFWETPWWTHSQEAQLMLRDAIGRAVKGESVRFESTHVSAAGEERDVDFCISPAFDDNGDVVYLVPEGYDITERKAAEQSLRGSEARYRATIEHAADAFFLLDAQGRIADVNQRACEHLDYTREELLSMCVTDVERSLQEREFEDIWNTLSANRDSDEPLTREGTHRRKDGSTLPVEVRVGLLTLDDEILLLALVRDITERKQAEEELREREEMIRALVETSRDWIWSIDLQGIHTYCNPAVEAILGYRPDELVGKPSLGLMHEEDRKTVESMLQECIADKRGWTNLLIRWRAKDGAWRFLESNAVPMLDEKGELSGFRGVDRDITERKRAEEDREKLEDQLRQAQKMEAVGQLAGGVAHDFNNVLQAIVGYGGMAREEADPGSTIREELDEVMKAADHAATLVRQLLAFSRRQVLKLEVLDLNEVVEELAKMIRRVIGEHIALSIRSEPGLRTVHADRGQLEQILMNLCVNGRDAMPEGGTLTIGTEDVELDAAFCQQHAWAKPGNYVLLNVSDTGTGMDEETQRHIFEPFYTTKGEGKGTGLGLSTVYGIVRQHHGMINVHSELGVGTTFRIYLPMSESSLKAAPDTKATIAPGGTEVILLAEDDESVRNLAQRFLEKAGYTVLAANNGEDAIRLFDSRAEDIGLAMLDVVMPSLGGRSVFNHIREIGAQIPVLFTSGYSSGGVHTNFVLEEDMQLIQKPYSRDELLSIVRKALDS